MQLGRHMRPQQLRTEEVLCRAVTSSQCMALMNRPLYMNTPGRTTVFARMQAALGILLKPN